MNEPAGRFRYALDPVCVGSCVLYAANRWLIKPCLPPDEWLIRGHFNDLFLIPCALPPLLFLHRRLGFRSTDYPPTGFEVGLHLFIWSIVCEAVGPRFVPGTTADAWDVVAYCIGGAVAWALWQRVWTRASATVSTPTASSAHPSPSSDRPATVSRPATDRQPP